MVVGLKISSFQRLIWEDSPKCTLHNPGDIFGTLASPDSGVWTFHWNYQWKVRTPDRVWAGQGPRNASWECHRWLIKGPPTFAGKSKNADRHWRFTELKRKFTIGKMQMYVKRGWCGSPPGVNDG